MQGGCSGAFFAAQCEPVPAAYAAAAQHSAIDVTPSFLLLWSTDAVSFTLRARRCLESIVYHHPNATVRVL